jgi:CheY-like chemotaxis protein
MTIRRTVLVVDDQKGVLSVTRDLLRIGGYSVLQASEGVAAVQIAQNQSTKIDLLLTDILMPKKGGLLLARTFRNLRPTLRLLFMSGSATRHEVHDELSGLTVPVLSKPFTGRELLNMLKEVLT